MLYSVHIYDFYVCVLYLGLGLASVVGKVFWYKVKIFNKASAKVNSVIRIGIYLMKISPGKLNETKEL